MSSFSINHTETSGVDDQAIEARIKKLSEYRDTISSVVDTGSYNEPESALNLPDDERLLEDVVKTVQSVTGGTTPQVVIVVGMGGSARGTRAVYQLLAENTQTKLVTVDTVGSSSVSKAVNTVKNHADKPEDIALCVVSKSGKTTETIGNASVLIDRLADMYSRRQALNRTVAVTDAGSQLDDLADEKNLHSVHIPEHVGGRFSVLSAAGLVPLLLAGTDIKNLLTGAKDMRNACLSGRPASDPAATLAAIIYDHTQSSRRIINHFLFHHQGLGLGRWSAQLVAESLGKSRNRQGEPVYAGLYPTTTLGPDDLHSLFQLQLGGPKNFFTIFVRETNSTENDFSEMIDGDFLVDDLSHIDGKTLGDIHQALAQATMSAFQEANRPFVEVSVPHLDAYRIGQFILLEELVVMYMGELLNVNAFDQPQVETYKETARSLLTDTI
jgi:glucose-6-phosphate isomerase